VRYCLLRLCGKGAIVNQPYEVDGEVYTAARTLGVVLYRERETLSLPAT